MRGRFALWTGSDLIHRADDRAAADRQIDMFFSPQDLHDYRRLDECLMSLEAWEALADDVLPSA